MPVSKPSMGPPSSQKGTNTAKSSDASSPAQEPPAAVAAASSDKAQASGSADLPTAVMTDASMAAPSLKPSAAVAGGIAAAWHSNVHVDGLWSINQDRNSWVYLDNGGWKKLSTQSPSGIVALTMVAAHAYEKHSVSSLYEADDGQISQLYVW